MKNLLITENRALATIDSCDEGTEIKTTQEKMNMIIIKQNGYDQFAEDTQRPSLLHKKPFFPSRKKDYI